MANMLLPFGQRPGRNRFHTGE